MEISFFKDHITTFYITDDIPSIKKEIIFKMLKSFECILEDGDIFNRELDERELETLTMEFTGSFLKLIERLINFQDFIFLEHINNFLTENMASPQLSSCLTLYEDLKNFANSGIDEKHYYAEVESISKKADIIQKYSSSLINLDKIPKHPTDIIRNFFIYEFFDGYELEIVQKAINNTGAVFKDSYTKKPSPTKTEKKIISKYGSLKNYKNAQIIEDILLGKF